MPFLAELETLTTPPKKSTNDKVVKAEAEAIKRKYDFKRAGVLWFCFLWSINIEQKKSDVWVETAAPLWVCRWMRMQIEGSVCVFIFFIFYFVGGLKPLVALSTPQRLRCNLLPQQIMGAESQSEHPLDTHYIQSIYIFIQTNIWLHMPSWANNKRQMCPPLRIQFDKLLLHKL